MASPLRIIIFAFRVVLLLIAVHAWRLFLISLSAPFNRILRYFYKQHPNHRDVNGYARLKCLEKFIFQERLKRERRDEFNRSVKVSLPNRISPRIEIFIFVIRLQE